MHWNFDRVVRLAFIGCVLALAAKPQDWISVGVKGGIPLNDPFLDRTFSFISDSVANPLGLPPTVVTQTDRFYSGSRTFLLGPTLEIRLPLGFSVEADALYHQLNVNSQASSMTTLGNFSAFLLPGATIAGRVDTWEFPILGKYRLPGKVLRPYLEAGPSFREAAKYMSSHGISAGIGVEAHVGPFRISPEVRFTHWGSGGSYPTPYHPVASPNQVELLAGVSTGSSSSAIVAPRTRLGKYLSVGVKGGFPFTTAFSIDRYGKITYPPNACTTAGCATPTVQTYRASRNYLVGPMIEVHLPLGVSIEADGLYAPLSFTPATVVPGLSSFLLAQQIIVFQGFPNAASWQFPVVGKYKFRVPFASPYLEGGPTFRTVASAIRPYLSNAGVTAGLGVEASVWKLRVSPEVRFVHWGHDSPYAIGVYASRRNQAQFLIGVSF